MEPFSDKDISGPRIQACFVITGCSDDSRVSINPDRKAEVCEFSGIWCRDMGCLNPAITEPLKNVDGPCVCSRFIDTVPPDECYVTINCDRDSKIVACACFGCDEFRLLYPVRVLPRKDIRSARVIPEIVFFGRADDSIIAAHCECCAEFVTTYCVTGVQFLMLDPSGFTPKKDLDRTGIPTVVCIIFRDTYHCVITTDADTCPEIIVNDSGACIELYAVSTTLSC